jgi:hypothetical protein
MRLLAHEATHAIQQRQGHVAPSPGDALYVGDASDPLETAAARTADEVMRGGPAITPAAVLAGAPSAAPGMIQRQVASPDIDPGSYEPGEERIVTERPRRAGQVNRTEFLKLLEQRLPGVVTETLASDQELSAHMPDVQSLVEQALQWSLAEYPDAEALDDCLHARFQSEFERVVVNRVGNGSSITEFISTAEHLVRAIEHQLRQNLKRDIDEMRAEEPTQEQWAARIASAGDGAAADKAQSERDHETKANRERHSGLLPGLIEHSVVSLWMDGGTKVKPTRRQMQALLKRGS